MSGKRFLDTNTIQLQSFANPSPVQLSGTASVYFVELTPYSLNYTNYLSVTGLSDGNIVTFLLFAIGVVYFKFDD